MFQNMIKSDKMEKKDKWANEKLYLSQWPIECLFQIFWTFNFRMQKCDVLWVTWSPEIDPNTVLEELWLWLIFWGEL